MFGCYRRGDANDADTYTAAITMVLCHYSAEVVKAVTDPFSGLPSRKKENGYSGLPDVADVKEACENEAARLVRMARYAAMQKPNYPRLRPPPAGPGAWATIRVPINTPQYEAFKKRTEKADVREWRWDQDGVLVVSYAWFESRAKPQMQPFRAFTDAELKAKYAAPTAAAPDGPAEAQAGHRSQTQPQPQPAELE